MRFKLPIVLFALFALLAAACSSSETAEVEESPTTTLESNIVNIGDGEDDGDDEEEYQEVVLLDEDETRSLREKIVGDGTDEIITHISTGDICDDFRMVPPHRDGGQATDLDENGLPYGTKYRTTYLEHSQPEPEPIQLEGSEYIYVPWREYEGRKIWESYPLDIELYNIYFSETIKRNDVAALTVLQPDLYLEEQANWRWFGCLWMQATKEIWDTADIYLPEIKALADEGKTIYRYNAEGTGIVDAVDHDAGFPLIIFEDDFGVVSSWYDVCPPRPEGNAKDISRYDLRGVDPALVKRAQEMALAIPESGTQEMRWFLEGAVTPEGKRVYTDHSEVSAERMLLNLSPGEPSDTTVNSDITSYSPSLILDGYFPGDWSEEALESLNRQVAATAVWASLSGFAVLGQNDATIWEKCTDLEGRNWEAPALGMSAHDFLENNISKGINFITEGGPASEVYVAYHSIYGSYTLLCSESQNIYFQDAISGEKVPRETTFGGPSSIVAQYYLNTGEGFIFQDAPLFVEGECRTSDGNLTPEFEQALAELAEYIRGRHSEWAVVPVGEWHSVSQEEAWNAHRYPAYRNQLICETKIPRGEIIDGELTRPISLPCDNDQWQEMLDSAVAAPERTNFLAGQKIGEVKSGTTLGGEYIDWFQNNQNSWIAQWYTERVQAYEYIGCGNDLAGYTSKPYPVNNIGHRTKRPWEQGLLPGINVNDEWGYPNPYEPCPGWEAPPEEDKYWWPLP